MSRDEVLQLLMMVSPETAAGAAGMRREPETKRLWRARRRATLYAMAGIGPFRPPGDGIAARQWALGDWVSAVIKRRNRLMQREYRRGKA